MEIKEDVDVKAESFIAINEEVDIDIKQEEISEDINFPEPFDVSCVCVCVCVCLLLDTFYQCPGMSVVFVMSVFLAT